MMHYDMCPNCFYPINGSSVCSKCSFELNTMKIPNGALPVFTTLNNRYLIGRVLGKGGFGITYIAQDKKHNHICAIKEYMPTEYATREGSSNTVYPFQDQKARYVFEHGKEKFIEEARTLLKLAKNPVVVDFWDCFMQYNTAYLVMEFLDGQDLRKLSRKNGGVINPDLSKKILVTVASSLMEIHKLNILHRDLSPENIIVTSNNQVKLIDFGAARNFVSNQNKGMSVLLKPGFAPPEQYSTKGVQGPWSDVYALCATFYNIVSGKPLVDALFRYRGEVQPSLHSLGCPVSKQTSDVIEKGMTLDYKQRYQNFKQLLDDIDMGTANPNPPPDPPFLIKGNSSNPYVITSIEGKEAVKSFIRENDILKIGRSKQSSQLVIEHDTNISRVHCYVRYDKARNIFYLSDVSANGTYFENGKRLDKNKEYMIASGTKFYLATKQNMLMVELAR